MPQSNKKNLKESSSLNGKNSNIPIFYVNPKSDHQKLFATTLAEAGYELTLFSSMQDCLLALHSRPCHLLIADEKVIRLEGIELICKSRIHKPRMRILILTDDLEEFPALKKAVKVGICSAGKKPVKTVGILHMVQDILQKDLNLLDQIKNSLSTRELEIIKMVGEGKVNKEIAHELNLSVRTVEFHRSRIMRKLNIDRFADLIKWALYLGLIEIEYHTPGICPLWQEAARNT